VAVNQGAFPYGGIELARLFDGNQDVAANLGGRPPSTFGMVISTPGGRRMGATQVGRRTLDVRRTSIRLTRAPRGVGQTAAARVGNAFAGPFTDLRAEGIVETPRHAMRTVHRFTPWWINTSWSARPRTKAQARKRYTAHVLFPSTGPGAQVLAVLTDGQQVPVGTNPIPLSLVSYFSVRSGQSGYVVVPTRRPARATAATMNVARQWSAPNPGPTLAVRVAKARRFKSIGLTARMVPVPNPDAVADTARQLGAR
jgi:hypothetical protein